MQHPHTPPPDKRSIIVDLYLLENPKTGRRRLMLVRELDGDPSQEGYVTAHTRGGSKIYSPASYAEHIAPYARRRFVLDADAAALVRAADAGALSYQEALTALEERRPRMLQTADERAREWETAGRLVRGVITDAQDCLRSMAA